MELHAPMLSAPRRPDPAHREPRLGRKGRRAGPRDGARRDPTSLASALEAGGLAVRLAVLAPEDDPATLAAGAVATGHDVVAAGGDGTVGPVAAAMASSGSHAATLGIIPLGSFNNVARGAGIPLDADEAIERIIAGRIVLLDAGAAWTLERVPANGDPFPPVPPSPHLFFEAAGIGIDAEGFGAARTGGRRGLRFAGPGRMASHATPRDAARRSRWTAGLSVSPRRR